MNIGRLGIWTGRFWSDRAAATLAAQELERLGYGAIWIPNRAEIFDFAGELLHATERIVVATGIASIWAHTPEQASAAFASLNRAHPNRFLLGLGVSHSHLVNREAAGRYTRPLERMRAYLDALDAAQPPVPQVDRVLAALGPRMLELARDRAAGAHPYLVTPDHTRFARDILGTGPLLAPEQAVVLETEATPARNIARKHLAAYLQAPNYVRNWLRLGFTQDDLAGGGSDRLVDALVAWGSLDTVRDRIEEHFRAGANHVCIQVLTAETQGLPMDEWWALAPGR